ncbi:Ig-like domain-containing protein [Bacillus sp. V59.32b]|uniref:Ig-like domain-containing protein n=1 Tax=Bacillus sp. V59.32b TaxID=1758642 RepID=UPI001359EDC1
MTGTAEAYSTVTVKAGSKTLGTAKADKYGKYKVTIKAQKKRTVLKITVQDRAGNISYTASKTVN